MPKHLPRDPQRPSALLDYVIRAKDLKNDAAFARLTRITPPRVSRMRHHKLRVTGDMLLQIHDTTGLPIPALRTALAMER